MKMYLFGNIVKYVYCANLALHLLFLFKKTIYFQNEKMYLATKEIEITLGFWEIKIYVSTLYFSPPHLPTASMEYSRKLWHCSNFTFPKRYWKLSKCCYHSLITAFEINGQLVFRDHQRLENYPFSRKETIQKDREMLWQFYAMFPIKR